VKRHGFASIARALCGCASALLTLGWAGAGLAGSVDTRTPIKHVIVIIGENRSFDHVFGLYRPRPGQTVSNLLSKGILNADGTPGPNFAQAAQFEAAPQASYYITARSKTPYAKLPPPQLAGAPTQPGDVSPPFRTIAEASAAEPALEPADERLLTTGATRLPYSKGLDTPDTRVANYDRLPDGPFLLTGPHLPYDSYTGDLIHRFYQMWQQSDCDLRNASRINPSGCRSDLYPFVSLTFSPRYPGSGNAMGVYNVNTHDAPLLKKLADEFTSSDNFHQCFMGGTGANHVMLAGDDVFFSDGKGEPARPPQNLIANPNPRPATNNTYIADGVWTNCSDPSQPGVGPIAAYLRELGLRTNCAAGHF